MKAIHKNIRSLTAHLSAHSWAKWTEDVCNQEVWVSTASLCLNHCLLRGMKFCLMVGMPDWRAWQEAKHRFLIDTLNSQTDCTTSGHEQNSMHIQSSRQAEGLSLCHPPVLILRILLSSPGIHFQLLKNSLHTDLHSLCLWGTAGMDLFL